MATSDHHKYHTYDINPSSMHTLAYNGEPPRRQHRECSVSRLIVLLLISLGVVGCGLLVGHEISEHYRLKAIVDCSSPLSNVHPSRVLPNSTLAAPLTVNSPSAALFKRKTNKEWNDEWIANHKEGRYCLKRKRPLRKFMGIKVNTRIREFQCQEWSEPEQFDVDPNLPDIVWLSHLQDEPSQKKHGWAAKKEKKKKEKHDQKKNHWSKWETTHKHEEEIEQHDIYPDEYDPSQFHTRDFQIENPEQNKIREMKEKEEKKYKKERKKAHKEEKKKIHKQKKKIIKELTIMSDRYPDGPPSHLYARDIILDGPIKMEVPASESNSDLELQLVQGNFDEPSEPSLSDSTSGEITLGSFDNKPAPSLSALLKLHTNILLTRKASPRRHHEIDPHLIKDAKKHVEQGQRCRKVKHNSWNFKHPLKCDWTPIPGSKKDIKEKAKANDKKLENLKKGKKPPVENMDEQVDWPWNRQTTLQTVRKAPLASHQASPQVTEKAKAKAVQETTLPSVIVPQAPKVAERPFFESSEWTETEPDIQPPQTITPVVITLSVDEPFTAANPPQTVVVESVADGDGKGKRKAVSPLRPVSVETLRAKASRILDPKPN